jgi:1-acyl-sn-glycerol-3-phosphate acyltransferase
MIAAALAAFARLVSGASVRWTAALEGERQRVYFANHTSHLDFVVIWSALQPAMRRRTRPVAGADYWERGAVKRFLSREVFRAMGTGACSIASTHCSSRRRYSFT